MTRTLLIIFAFCGFSQTGWTQNAALLKQQADAFFLQKKYEEALPLFLRHEQAKPGDTQVLTRTGICYYHTNQLVLAESLLRQAATLRHSPPPEAFLYLAKIYHARWAFEDAVRMYKVFLKNTGREHPLRAAVKDDIRRCATGMRVQRTPPDAAVMNFGEAVNSKGDDFRPLLSPNSSGRMYFSSIRPGNAGCGGDGACGSDMFFTELENGDWQPPRRLSVFLNTIENEVAQAFGKEGAQLYFFRGETLFSGDILVDTFRQDVTGRTLFSKEFSGPMRAWEGDCAPFFFNDTILLFASRRPGGFGGLDLYVSTFTNGEWTAAQNLGPAINSIYDETSPFLAADGRTLWFSTNDPLRSIGDLDILRSTYIDRTLNWPPPRNPGMPLNSAGDDTDFVLSPDGSRAFFSSSRKEGLGGKDLYFALFDAPRKEQTETSIPAAFPLVSAYRKAVPGASEAALPPEDIFGSGGPVAFSPVYYSPSGELFAAGLRDLRVLSQLMKKWPQAKIVLAAHCDSSDPSPQTGQGILRAVSDSLRRWEVPLENLLLRNIRATYPATTDAPATNRRVGIFISNPDELPVTIRFNEPSAAGVAGAFFRKAMHSLFYSVRVPLNGSVSLDDLFRLYPDGMAEQSPASGTSCFGVGMYLTFQSAEQWRRDVAEHGFPLARVAAFVNGWEISKEEARQHVERFPDLEGFIGR
jgi:WD40 repeat protein